MTVRANKPEFNIREKLKSLDYSHVPYEKMPSGTVISSVVWKVPALAVSTSGSWAYNTIPNSANTYAVDNFTFKKKLSSSIVQGVVLGHVDASAASGHPTVVSLTNGKSGLPTDVVYGATYRHQRVQGQEPDAYVFAFEDDMLNQDDPFNPSYYLRCHSAATAMYFSRMNAGTTPNNPYRIIFQEVVR